MKSRFTVFASLLPLLCGAQEPYTVDEDGLAVFAIESTVAFESDRSIPFRYPWIPEIECDDCITINMSGGTATYTYLATELYPDNRNVEVDVVAWLSHFSNPDHVFVYGYVFLAREWNGQLYFLSGSPVWGIDPDESREYITNPEFIEALGLSQLVQAIDTPDCVRLDLQDLSQWIADLQEGTNVERRDNQMCAVRGVFVEDMVGSFPGTRPGR